MPKKEIRDSRVRSAVLCDDVRPEANGKLMLLGVYTGDVVLAEFPANVSLAVYLDLELPKGTHHFHIRSRTGDKIHSGMEADLVVLKTSVFGLHTPRLPILVEEQGDLVFDVQVNSDPWTVALTKSILLSTTTNKE